MKLELKHILPYANYELRGEFLQMPDILHSIDLENKILSSLNHGNCLIGDFVPYLRPLNFKFITQNKFLIDGKMQYFSIYDMLAIEKLGKDYKNIKYMPYYVFQALVNQHYDIFGLIESGLAKPLLKS